MDRRANRIKLEDCEHRKLYKVIARNILIGVFNKETQEFQGIREKFGSRFVDGESHWDAPAFATCAPMEVIGELPSEIDINIYLGSKCQDCGCACEYKYLEKSREITLSNGSKMMVDGEWVHTEPTACSSVRAMAVRNLPLFNWLEEQEKIHASWRQEKYDIIQQEIADRKNK